MSLKRLNKGQETLAKRKGASEKTIEMEQTSEQRRQCLSALTGKICSLGWQTPRFVESGYRLSMYFDMGPEWSAA